MSLFPFSNNWKTQNPDLLGCCLKKKKEKYKKGHERERKHRNSDLEYLV